MQHFVWKPDYEVHVPFMDDEHRELAARLNALFLPMSRGEEPAVLAPLLDALVQHTAAHFESEEQAFARFAYPKGAAHHAVHAELLEKVCHLQKEFLAGRQQLTLTAMQFLKVWLVEHIGKEGVRRLPAPAAPRGPNAAHASGRLTIWASAFFSGRASPGSPARPPA